MTVDDEHDPDDTLFRRALDRVAGPAPDPVAGWASLAGRDAPVHRPDRRLPRLVVLATAAATVGVLLTLARPSIDDGPVAMAPPAPPTAPASTSVAAAVSSAATAATAATTATAAAPVATAPGVPDPATTPTAPPRTDARDPATGPEGAVPTAPPLAPGDGAGTTARTPEGTGSPPPPSPTSAVPSSVGAGRTPASPRRSVAVTGGTVSAIVDGDRLVDPAVVAAPGWTAEVVERRDDRIEVRFRSAERTVTVRVRPDGDGLRVDDRS